MSGQISTLKFNAVIEGTEKVHSFVKRLLGIAEFYHKDTMILTISEESFLLFRGGDSALSTSMTELWLNNKQCFDQYEFMETERGQVSFEVESEQIFDALKGLDMLKLRIDLLKLRVVQVDSNLHLRIKIPNLNATHDVTTDLKPLVDSNEYRMPSNNRDYISVLIAESSRLEKILNGFKHMNLNVLEIILCVSKKEMRICGTDTGCKSTVILKDLSLRQHIGSSDNNDVTDSVKVRVSLQNLHTLFRNFVDAAEPLEIRVANEDSARFILKKLDGIFTLFISHQNL
ncbi:unnamed protein product [Bursaphelenchus xylophilus]|uniref:(pine wood nematode) hypothetical protein n=1 Tax=Bursaphelenchus xylophilus TaxID=6326 RepID=A0A1I7RNU0_BURXY|nr:unnamed protein product [Bursaphelenchus xylophilus]CAG9124291.1 unnamed protein product [Bursaphelenchus xylophilus]